VVRLRLAGGCNGCPSSSVTVTAIERAIEDAAPEVVRVEVEGGTALPRGVGAGGRTLLPMLARRRPRSRLSPRCGCPWRTRPTSRPVRSRYTVAGGSTLVANIDGALFAYRDRCELLVFAGPRGSPGDVLRCADCSQHFDLRRAVSAATAPICT
jgi:hypothetical protein